MHDQKPLTSNLVSIGSKCYFYLKLRVPLVVALIHFGFIQANSARILVDLFTKNLAADVRENKSQFDWIMETSPFHRNCRTVIPWTDRFTYDFTFRPFHSVETMRSMCAQATLEFVYFSPYSRCVCVAHSQCFCTSYMCSIVMCSARTQFIQVTTSIFMEKEKSRAASRKRNSPKITNRFWIERSEFCTSNEWNATDSIVVCFVFLYLTMIHLFLWYEMDFSVDR